MGRVLPRLRTIVGTVLGLLLAATTLIVVGSGPAAAAPPAPTGLTASGAPIPTLSWDRVAGATTYVVQGSENPSFTAPLVFSQSTANISYVPVRVLKEGTLYWRVQAVDGTGSSAFTEATPPATIGTHAAPTGITVSPGEQIMPPVAPPVIHWNAIAGAVGYDVEVDGEGDGVGGIVKSGIKTTTYVWPDPQGVGETGGQADFFVRVRAKFDNSLQTDWSSYVAYNVNQLPPVTYAGACPTGLVCAPDPVTGVRPTVDVEDVVFDWDPVKGAQKYEIWVSADSEFSGTPVDKLIVSGTRYSPEESYDNANYYWKVRAINAAGQPTPWPASGSIFRRRWAVAPSLVYPPDSATPVTGDLYFQWTPVQHATRYSLEVGTDPNFTPGTYSICTTASTTFTVGYRDDSCSRGTLRLNQGAPYYWRVRAIDAPTGIVSLYSPINTVAFDTGGLIRVAPANGATVSVPTLRWGVASQTIQEPAPSIKASTSYDVVLKDKNLEEVDSELTFAQSWTTTQELDPALSPYHWTVVARGAFNHPSPLYWSGSFTYEAPTAGATPLAANPSEYGDSQARFPSLSWQPIANAKYYRLTVFNSAGFALAASTTPVLNTNLYQAAVTDWNDYFLTHPGTYTYGVTAYDENDVALGSTAPGNRGTFAIGTLLPATGQRLALDGQSIDTGPRCSLLWNESDPVNTTCGPVPATPVLDWEPVPGAGGYMVYLFEESDLTTPVYNPQLIATESTRWTPDAQVNQALRESTAGGAYYWFIRPCVTIQPFRNCGPDPASLIDSATSAFKKQSPPVLLNSPDDQAAIADEVTFSWEDYRTTNAAAPQFPVGGARSHQSGMTYRLQVAQSATVTDANAIDDVTVDQTSYTAFTDLYPEGDLYWRVQAIDAAGNRLAFSETRGVVKATPATNLDPTVAAANERSYVDDDPDDPGDPDDPIGTARPLFNSHVTTGEFAFRWTAEAFDSTWSIEVYKNDDTTGSLGNRVFALTTSKQSAAINTTALAPSSQPYRWRIRRTDAYGNQGAWSDYGRFWVDPTPLTLVGPSDGSQQPPNGPLLTWQAYTNGTEQAYRYAVNVRNAANATVTSIASTSATAWAPTINFTTGTYSWVVTAFDASGNVVGTSPDGLNGNPPPWTFTVDTALVATAKPAIQAPDGAQVGKTLTSTPPTWSQPGVTSTYQWLRNGAAITGATGPTYTLASADVDRAITLRVTGKKAGYTDGTTVSDPVTGNPGAAIVPTEMPTLSGNAAARETLASTAGAWPSSTTVTYQWFVNGLAVAKETKAAYVVRTRDAGLPVYCRVTGTKPGFLPGTADTGALAVAKLSSKTTATAVKSKITQRQRGVLTVKVDLIDLGVTLGQVEVREGNKLIASAGLQTGKNGVLSLRLKKLKLGKHKLTVTYRGSVSTLPSSSRVTIKVVKRAP